jgi:hypothetical protein
MKKIKDVQDILLWFGSNRKHQKEVFAVINCTVFWRLFYTEKMFIFDETDRTFRSSFEDCPY